jgi:hypothetical protein
MTALSEPPEKVEARGREVHARVAAEARAQAETARRAARERRRLANNRAGTAAFDMTVAGGESNRRPAQDDGGELQHVPLTLAVNF